jgi:hypothetical protein
MKRTTANSTRYAALLLAPGFSQVHGGIEHSKTVLTVFYVHGPAATRLKPGANERSARKGLWKFEP